MWLLGEEEIDEAVVEVVVKAELAEEVDVRVLLLDRRLEPELEEVWWLDPELLRCSVFLVSIDLPDFDDCSDDLEDFWPAAFIRVFRSEELLGPFLLVVLERVLTEGAGEAYNSNKLFT